MDKKQALAKLKDLEEETAKLRAIIEAPETPFEKVKNYSDVCKLLREEELELSDFNFLAKEYRKKALAHAQLQQIQKLFNGTWKADILDGNQKKWYPYYSTVSGGLVFCRSTWDPANFRGEVCFYKDQEISDFVGKTFIDIYKTLV